MLVCWFGFCLVIRVFLVLIVVVCVSVVMRSCFRIICFI